VRRALGQILENPLHPPGIVVHPLRGRPAREFPDRWIAKLLGGWVATYSVHPDGLPPLGGRLIALHALVRLV
jgi:hypothetical protein